jgi:hypothetical protein
VYTIQPTSALARPSSPSSSSPPPPTTLFNNSQIQKGRFVIQDLDTQPTELCRSLSEDLDFPRRTSSLPPPLPRLRGRFEVTELEEDQNVVDNNNNKTSSDVLLEEAIAVLTKRASGVLDECRVLRDENAQLRRENAQLRALIAKLSNL